MFARARMLTSATMLALFSVACGDVTSPTAIAPTLSPRFSGGVDIPGQVSGGGGGGGGQVATSCGTITAQTMFIQVYTTRIGIGVNGTATNCGNTRVAFEVVVVDDDPNPACTITFPRYIAAKNTDPTLSNGYAVLSTLVNCKNIMHNFTITLRDTRTNTVLATTSASAFL